MDNFKDWAKEIGCAITVTNKEGEIIYMNNKSANTFEKWGGAELIGMSMFDCHSTSSQSVIHRLYDNAETNVYTIEKNGIKKLIYQTPWYTNGELSGLVELSLEIPIVIPHHIRD